MKVITEVSEEQASRVWKARVMNPEKYEEVVMVRGEGMGVVGCEGGGEGGRGSGVWWGGTGGTGVVSSFP